MTREDRAIDAIIDSAEDGRPIKIEHLVVLAEAVVRVGRTGGEARLRRALRPDQRRGLSQEQAARKAERNRLIQHLWHSQPAWSGEQPSRAAHLMALSAGRYETGNWKRDRYRDNPPADVLSATWWRILKLDAGLPREKQIWRILRQDIQTRALDVLRAG